MSRAGYFQRPLLPLAVAAFLGCGIGAALPGPAPVYAVLAASAGLAAFPLRRSAWVWAVLLGGAAAAYAGLAANASAPASDDICRWIPCRLLRVEGVLDSPPTAAAGGRGWTGELRCVSTVWERARRPAGGRLRFYAPGPRPEWNPGDVIAVTGRLEGIEGPHNPGEFDLRAYYARQGIRARLAGRDRSAAVRLESVGPASTGWWIGAVRRRIQGRIRAAGPDRAAPLLNSLVLGDRSGLARADLETLTAAGLAHVLAVSGMNVSLVWATLYFLARLARLPRRAGLLLAVAGVWLFALAAGGGPSVVRAAWMATGLALGFLGERRSDPESGLAFAALLLLAGSPLAAGDAGFQLSFAATLSILAVWPSDRPARAKSAWTAAGRWLADSLRVTGAACLGTAPLCLYYFSSVTPAALATNLAAAPLVSIATHGGLLLGTLGGAVAGLDRAVGWAAGESVRWLLKLAEAGAAWPGGRVFLWPPSAGWVVGMYLAAGLARFHAPTRWPALGVLVLLLAAYPAFAPAPPRPDALRVTFLDLNLGESALVERGESRVLVDTGSESEFLWRVKPFLAALGINRLDALVLSHADDDHAGGLAACLRLFKPRAVFTAAGARARLRPPPAAWGSAAAPALREGDTLEAAPGVVLETLWPPAGAGSGRNHDSLVVRFRAPGGGVVFTGDGPESAERRWAAAAACAVLKCGHHGARTSTGETLLLAAAPEIAVFCPGARNPYGFPHPETLERTRRWARQTLRTDKQGAVRVEWDRQNVRWRSWR